MRNRSKRNSFVTNRSEMPSNRKAMNEGRFDMYGDLLPDDNRNKFNIQTIDMIPSDAKRCLISFDGKSVYSNAKFFPGEIIEICPARRIAKTSLYAREIRDLAFEVKENTEYVIPMGYCQFYDIDDHMSGIPNCDWEWDEKQMAVIIRAIRRIDKGEKLVLNIEE